MLNSPPQSAILPDFLNQEHRFTIPKSQISQAEKQEGDEYRQWQSVLHFTQTQKVQQSLFRSIESQLPLISWSIIEKLVK